MKQVILFAGTTEGRRLGHWLAGEGIEVLACTATAYGSLLLKEQEHLEVRAGRLDCEEMQRLFGEEGRPLVLDATHPYAVEVSRNIQAACQGAGCEYIRLIRPQTDRKQTEEKDCVTVNSVEEAVSWLAGTKGRILVTTGSKELHRFQKLPHYEERVFARVLPTPQVVEECQKLGFLGQHLICMQGPFSREMNTAMLRQTGASWLVTKESGKEGGFEEKLAAAREAGAGIVLIGRPQEQEGMSVEEGTALLKKRFSIEKGPKGDLLESEEKKCNLWEERKKADFKKEEVREGGRRAVLAGVGMGTPETMTQEVWRVFQEADCILGAGRMLESLRSLEKPMLDAYDPGKMTAYLREHPGCTRIAVALSGDVGFYSGAKRLIEAFEQERIQTELLPGISSVSYLCSRLRIPWENVKLMSMHGRRGNLIGAVRANLRTFTLLGGKDTVEALCRELLSYGLGEVKIYVGERLHYPEERITEGKPGELKDRSFDGLCAALIENPACQRGTPACIPDEAFVRGKAPMTKSEIRCLSVAKLRLRRDSVIYDIGAGTGSVSVEMALQASEGTVWAVEKEAEALELIRENCRKHQVSNVAVREGTAPEALKELPVPTHAFLGGSSGGMKEILQLLLKKNPRIRIVINAVTLETIGEAAQCLKELPFADTEVIQVQLARARSLGRYQLMTGQNPVYIFSGEGSLSKETSQRSSQAGEPGPEQECV